MLTNIGQRALQSLVRFGQHGRGRLQQKPDHGVAVAVILPDVIGGKYTLEDPVQLVFHLVGEDRRKLIELIQGKRSVDLHLQKDPAAGHSSRFGVDVVRDRLLLVGGCNEEAPLSRLLRLAASQRNIVASLHRLHDGKIGQNLDVADPLVV